MPRASVFEHAYAVVMAGGTGTRFWPLSRRKHPKQLLAFFGGGTLLEQTVSRLQPFIPPQRIYVFTNQAIWKEVRRRLPGIPASHVVAEPAGRNTAPTLGVAANEILKRDPDGLMVVLPSDQVIARPARFRQVLRAACQVASVEGRSVVVGLRPSRPETGYGYIRLGKREGPVSGQEVFRVEKFTEKPPLEMARRYVKSGRYLWNGGMFIWRASTLLRNFERHEPRMARQLDAIAAAGGVGNRRALCRLFPRLEKISIDYAIMEKISGIFVVAAEIGWNDVGSWTVVRELSPKDREGNVRPQRSLCLGSRDNIIISNKRFVVAVGVHNLAIVETDDALLVCACDQSQGVGKAVQELERLGLRDLL
jgi:mannose-1-phosphate guanylyltransferase